MELLDSNGDALKSIKASERSRAHLNSKGNINRTFPDMATLEKQGESIYAKEQDKIKEEYENDVKAGFDVKDINSILAFEPGYTPVGNSLLLKNIHKEQRKDQLFLPPGVGENPQGIVIVAGLYATIFRKGDIVSFNATMGGQIPTVKRKLNNVEFVEVDATYISGIHKPEAEIRERVK
jgi:hypothetical protein